MVDVKKGHVNSRSEAIDEQHALENEGWEFLGSNEQGMSDKSIYDMQMRMRNENPDVKFKSISYNQEPTGRLMTTVLYKSINMKKYNRAELERMTEDMYNLHPLAVQVLDEYERRYGVKEADWEFIYDEMPWGRINIEGGGTLADAVYDYIKTFDMTKGSKNMKKDDAQSKYAVSYVLVADGRLIDGGTEHRSIERAVRRAEKLFEDGEYYTIDIKEAFGDLVGSYEYGEFIEKGESMKKNITGGTSFSVSTNAGILDYEPLRMDKWMAEFRIGRRKFKSYVSWDSYDSSWRVEISYPMGITWGTFSRKIPDLDTSAIADAVNNQIMEHTRSLSESESIHWMDKSKKDGTMKKYNLSYDSRSVERGWKKGPFAFYWMSGNDGELIETASEGTSRQDAMERAKELTESEGADILVVDQKTGEETLVRMTKDLKKEENMAEYIYTILKYQPIILMSWGATNFRALPGNKGLAFNVNGFNYKGEVKVIFDRGADAFIVEAGSNRQDDVYFDELTDVIDRMVETGGKSTEQYQAQVSEWLQTTDPFTGEPLEKGKSASAEESEEFYKMAKARKDRGKMQKNDLVEQVVSELKAMGVSVEYEYPGFGLFDGDEDIVFGDQNVEAGQIEMQANSESYVFSGSAEDIAIKMKAKYDMLMRVKKLDDIFKSDFKSVTKVSDKTDGTKNNPAINPSHAYRLCAKAQKESGRKGLTKDAMFKILGMSPDRMLSDFKDSIRKIDSADGGIYIFDEKAVR